MVADGWLIRRLSATFRVEMLRSSGKPAVALSRDIAASMANTSVLSGNIAAQAEIEALVDNRVGENIAVSMAMVLP